MKQKQASYLTGKLLLAMPAIGDQRFHRSVIFMAAHDENGAMGLVINSDLPELGFENLLDQLGISSKIEVDLKNLNLPVMSGGPVEKSRGFLLHTTDFHQKETIPVDDDFSITGTIDALTKVAKGNGPDHALFILGYAGWTAGQLEQELQKNAWLVLDSDPALVFHEKTGDKWNMAIDKLGIDPAMLSGEIGRA